MGGWGSLISKVTQNIKFWPYRQSKAGLTLMFYCLMVQNPDFLHANEINSNHLTTLHVGKVFLQKYQIIFLVMCVD